MQTHNVARRSTPQTRVPLILAALGSRVNLVASEITSPLNSEYTSFVA
jgi:hypothetical protein